ncbi:NUDIX hydrolase (macronuclear) [Tetrahymena thermophila SB210]|uniref:NUDIX hydrolase n=1 Tax=Tetrahymena thermophila (strain SB210) TaxID=312017 RepID=I7MF50_TETTS|nr:NUDIX hydrolase [Tetrahymena thermophila SB210]EAR98488.1 NUDIX hydrolase [Tetrahymena thermophila SB210]|eukprot:XP_001018733.1 NUDIX hydrolase [Tetrahymena thermophila SB210]
MSLKQIIKTGISGLVFDSKQPRKILLIKREQPPYHNQWSFPGGRLEFGELIENGIKREVKEETGYTVDLIGNNYNIHEVIRQDTHYLIFSASCVIQSYSKGHEKIFSQFFYLDQYLGKDTNEKFNISEIKDEESIPNFHQILQKMLKQDFNIEPIEKKNVK